MGKKRALSSHDLPLLYAEITNGKGFEWVKFRIAQTRTLLPRGVIARGRKKQIS